MSSIDAWRNELACDVAEHVGVASRRGPTPYWFRRGAVSEATLALLDKDVTLSWVRVEDAEPEDHAYGRTD